MSPYVSSILQNEKHGVLLLLQVGTVYQNFVCAPDVLQQGLENKQHPLV